MSISLQEKNAKIIGPIMRTIEAAKKEGFPVANIRQALPKLTGVSLAALADELGVSRATITNVMAYERGSVEIQRRIAAFFGVPPGEIFETHNRTPFHVLENGNNGQE